MIEVSAGIVWDGAGRVLICQRGEGRHHAHLWEFPGGKLEAGESPAACLIRELQEELSLPVTVRGIRLSSVTEGIRFHFIDAETAAQPIPTEHEDLRFVPPQDLLRFPFCPADEPVAQKLAFAGVRHAIWDFDGTLMDTYPAMVRAFVAGAADCGVSCTPERTLTLMKNCLRHCCDVIGAESGLPADTLAEAFRRHEQDEMRRGVPPLPGIPEALEAMAQSGIRHYVATHRDMGCRDLLEQAGIAHHFSGFVTKEDGLPRKPAPDMLRCLMTRHGLSPAACVMIGDRPLDTEAGLAAGMRSILLDSDGRFPQGTCDLRVSCVRALISLFGDGRISNSML